MIARIAVLVVAAAALAGCGGGKKSSTPTTAPPTTATTTQAATAPAPATTTTETATTPVPGPVTIAVTVSGGKPVGGIRDATVKQGRAVALVVHSDIADEVHLHGYDLTRDVAAGGTATIRFKASIAGVFEVELESRSLQIVELTVKP